MTEHRPLYHACSGDLQDLQRPIPVHGALLQHYTDGTTSRDVILLLPILDSPVSDEDATPVVCMRPIPLQDGLFCMCNVETVQTCPCCGFAVCQTHLSNRSISLPDEAGEKLLCETCAMFSIETIFAMHAFRTIVNQPSCNSIKEQSPMYVLEEDMEEESDFPLLLTQTDHTDEQENTPSWILTTPVAPHMQESPAELD